MSAASQTGWVNWLPAGSLDRANVPPVSTPLSTWGSTSVVVPSLTGDRGPTGPAWIGGSHQGPVGVAERGGGAAEVHRGLVE